MLRLKINRREAVGIIGCLSSWAIQFRPGGIIEKKLIAGAVEWDKDPKELLAAMIETGWLDDRGDDTVYYHDWHEITRNYRRGKNDAAERTRKGRILRGELPPDTAEQPSPDRSSSPEAQAADAYLKWNPNCTMKRATIIWEFGAAKKKAVLAGDTSFMERLHTACHDQKAAENVGVWDLLKSLLPKSKDEGKVDELLAHFQERDKKLRKEARAQ